MEETENGRRPGEYFDGYKWRSIDEEKEEKTSEPKSSNSDMAYELSDRELEVLRLMASKMTAKQMSEKIGISPRTIQFHQLNLYWKLGISGRDSRMLAVAKGRKLGLIK